jgi:hypothetical protein
MRKLIGCGVLMAAMAVGCANGKKVEKDHHAEAPTPVVKTDKYVAFGEPMKLDDAATVPVNAVLADPAKYAGKPVRVSGTVNGVCEAKGCWLEMAGPNGEAMFVKFTCPVQGRLIPMEAKGKPVVVEGELVIKEISEEDARHIAEEGGKTPAQIAAIKGPQKQVSLKGPSAKIAM